MPTLAEKWIEQGLQQGLEQGLEQGQQKALRESTLELLKLRFDATPAGTASRLAEIEELDILRTLHRQAATAGSLAAFEQFLASLD